MTAVLYTSAIANEIINIFRNWTNLIMSVAAASKPLETTPL